jgi:hypothetical protein
MGQDLWEDVSMAMILPRYPPSHRFASWIILRRIVDAGHFKVFHLFASIARAPSHPLCVLRNA